MPVIGTAMVIDAAIVMGAAMFAIADAAIVGIAAIAGAATVVIAGAAIGSVGDVPEGGVP